MNRMRFLLGVGLVYSITTGIVLAQEVSSKATPSTSTQQTAACPCANESRDIPKEGYVPDSVTATKIAEAVMGGHYGEKETRSLRPFTATLYEDVWTVTRRCKSWCVGSNPTVKLLKQNGQIISVTSIYLK